MPPSFPVRGGSEVVSQRVPAVAAQKPKRPSDLKSYGTLRNPFRFLLYVLGVHNGQIRKGSEGFRKLLFALGRWLVKTEPQADPDVALSVGLDCC